MPSSKPSARKSHSSAKPFPLQPTEDRIVVRLDPQAERTKGGVVIPGIVNERPYTGVVLAVGPGKLLKDGRRITPDVKPGDRVFFGRQWGQQIPWPNEDHDTTEVRILEWQHLLAKLAPDAEFDPTIMPH